MMSAAGEDDDWHMLAGSEAAHTKNNNNSNTDDNDIDDDDDGAAVEIDVDDDDDDDFDTLRVSSATTIKSATLSPSPNTVSNPSSAPLPSSTPATTTTTSPGGSLKSYYNSRKNKLIASLYNAYNNYSPGSLWQLHPTEPIWLLGRSFAPGVGFNARGHAVAVSNHVVVVNDDGSVVRSGTLAPHLREFADHFRSVLFCSYRKNFPRIAGTHFTTDAGWGCMLRTGQMLLARAVLVQLSPPNWQLTDADVQSPFSVYRRVVRWFNDEPHDAPFSIHQFIEVQRLACARRGDAHQMQLAAGSWFTPTEVACIIRDVVRINAAVLDSLEVYVARDGELNRRAVEQLATPTSSSSSQSLSLPDGAERPWNHVVLLIPVRLGVDALHECYVQPLRKLLTMPQTLGVFGGRPRQSLYFVGVQGDDVLFLDPHLVQSWQPPHAKFDDATNHLAAPQRMRLRDVDPSMTIGFFLRTRADFDMVLAQLDAFAADMVHFVSVVDAPVVPEQPGEVAPTAAAVEQARAAMLSRRIKSQPEGSIVRRRSERTTSDPPPNPPVDVVAGNGAAAAATTTNTTTPTTHSNVSPREASTASQLDISESRLCDDELCVHALDAGGALMQWLQRKKWVIVQHQPATGKSLAGSGESSPTSSDAGGGGLLGRWRQPRRDAGGSSDDDVELRSDGATSLKHVATAFVVAHAQGVHVHFRPQLEVMYEREELHQPRWRVTVRYYAHLKPGTASAMTLLTAGLSLVVAANSVSKHVREAPALVDEVWQVLGVDGRCGADTPSSSAPISIASSTQSVVTPPTSAGDIEVGSDK